MERTAIQEAVRAGIFGLCTADALGVPVEFKTREYLREHPVTEMLGNGTYHQPAGTWSDDSSMALCLADSLGKRRGLDPEDIMKRFQRWQDKGQYSPWGECFDIGNATAWALRRYELGSPALSCGGADEHSNGNGSLMRILPIVYPLYCQYGPDLPAQPQAMEAVHTVSGLTHAHSLSKSACGIYISIAARLLDGAAVGEAAAQGVSGALAFYREREEFLPVLDKWERVASPDTLRALGEEGISSTGYVLHTLEAALWCLLTTDSYRACVERAVNLGGDTDTTGAVAGGLAGLAYGLQGIPAEWLEALAAKPLVESCCRALANYAARL